MGADATFTGIIKKVKTVGDATIEYLKTDKNDATINASKQQNTKFSVKITTTNALAPTVIDGSNTVSSFAFAEIISGSGMGSALVANQTLTEDADYYYIQLNNVNCPQSLLTIIDAVDDIKPSYTFTFHNQKLTGKVKVSKATGLVMAIENIKITGTMDLAGSTFGLADGKGYANEFNCPAITMTY